MQNITVTLSKNLKQKPADESALGFGRLFTDHMFCSLQLLMHYSD